MTLTCEDGQIKAHKVIISPIKYLKEDWMSLKAMLKHFDYNFKLK